MTFKEQVQQDIIQTFFNEDEFAAWHDIDGENMLAILMEDDLEQRDRCMETMSRLALFNTIELPIYKNAVAIFVPAFLFGKRLGVGSEILLDRERRLEIKEFINESGVYIIFASEVL